MLVGRQRVNKTKGKKLVPVIKPQEAQDEPTHWRRGLRNTHELRSPPLISHPASDSLNGKHIVCVFLEVPTVDKDPFHPSLISVT